MRYVKIVLAALAIGVFGYGFWQSAQRGVYRISDVIVEPFDGASSEISNHFLPEIKTQLAKHSGKDIWSIDVGEVAQEVLKNAWVEDVRVQRGLPNVLRVRLSPKKVSAVYVGDQGRIVPIAKDATILPDLPAGKIPNVPVIRQGELIDRKELRKQMLSILDELPETGSLSRSSVDEISVDRQNSFWLSLIERDVQVRMGNSNIGIRAARVERVLDYLKNNNLQARVIDADFSKKVVVKPRKRR